MARLGQAADRIQRTLHGAIVEGIRRSRAAQAQRTEPGEAAERGVPPASCVSGPPSVMPMSSAPVVQPFRRARPTTPDAETALGLLLAEPLLIRRPLIEVDGWRTVGFDAAALERRLGVGFDTTVPDGCARRD